MEGEGCRRHQDSPKQADKDVSSSDEARFNFQDLL